MRVALADRIARPPIWALGVVGAYLAAVGACALLAGSVGPTLCMLRRVTGYPCPTCGSTRMVLAVLDLRITDAFLHNPLMFLLCIVGIALLTIRFATARRIVWITSAASRRVFIAVMLLAFLANWAYLLTVGS